jgi:hypothetical protein
MSRGWVSKDDRPAVAHALEIAGFERYVVRGRRVLAVDIAYSIRSEFLDASEAAIRSHRAELDAGAIVTVSLPEGGYDGRVVVTIRPGDRASFGTDWEGSDPTRFPARIKAAATALLNCGCEGQFEVSHQNGSLAIRSV